MSTTASMHVSSNPPEVSGVRSAGQGEDTSSLEASKSLHVPGARSSDNDHSPSSFSSKQPQQGEPPISDSASSSTRMTRKRAADLANLEDSNRTVNQEQEISPQREQRPAATPAHICLCQPDPKIPRPRNGMLLQLALDLYC